MTPVDNPGVPDKVSWILKEVLGILELSLRVLKESLWSWGHSK